MRERERETHKTDVTYRWTYIQEEDDQRERERRQM